MFETVTFHVPGLSCQHCQVAVTEEVSGVSGVQGVLVDLDSKLVQINGHALDDAALRAAIAEAGYEVA
jgi:copper chaperone